LSLSVRSSSDIHGVNVNLLRSAHLTVIHPVPGGAYPKVERIISIIVDSAQ